MSLQLCNTQQNYRWINSTSGKLNNLYSWFWGWPVPLNVQTLYWMAFCLQGCTVIERNVYKKNSWTGYHTAFSSSFSKDREKTKQEADNHTPHPRQIWNYLQMTRMNESKWDHVNLCQYCALHRVSSSSWISQKMWYKSTRPASTSWRGLWGSPTARWPRGRNASPQLLLLEEPPSANK